MHLNIEFKARCTSPDKVREILKREKAEYRGRDNQIDIYFNVPLGRLKLRKGNIENSLIAYEREDHAGTKQCKFLLLKTDPNSPLETILTTALGVKVVVNKQRDIYFIGNVKFHIDQVQNIGSFVEVEAIDMNGDIGKDRLQKQCDKYKEMFEIKSEDLIAESYSDLLIRTIINNK